MPLASSAVATCSAAATKPTNTTRLRDDVVSQRNAFARRAMKAIEDRRADREKVK